MMKLVIKRVVTESGAQAVAADFYGEELHAEMARLGAPASDISADTTDVTYGLLDGRRPTRGFVLQKRPASVDWPEGVTARVQMRSTTVDPAGIRAFQAEVKDRVQECLNRWQPLAVTMTIAIAK